MTMETTLILNAEIGNDGNRTRKLNRMQKRVGGNKRDGDIIKGNHRDGAPA
jgi:hypothetical protein